MEVLLALAAITLTLGILGRLLQSSSKSPPSPDSARDVGFMTGMMGGSMEDAFVAQYALRRAREGSQDRDHRESDSEREPEADTDFHSDSDSDFD